MTCGGVFFFFGVGAFLAAAIVGVFFCAYSSINFAKSLPRSVKGGGSVLNAAALM